MGEQPRRVTRDGRRVMAVVDGWVTRGEQPDPAQAGVSNQTRDGLGEQPRRVKATRPGMA